MSCPCPAFVVLASPLRAGLAVLVLLSAVLLSEPVAAQQVAAPPAEPPSTARPLLQASELKTFFFTPTHADVHDLESIASRLHGRVVWVVERGGYDGSPVPNLQVLGDTIVIHDTDEVAQRIGEALHGLDTQVGEQLAKAAVEPEPEVETVEWRPAHISLDTAWSALSQRQQLFVSLVQERRALVIRAEPEYVAEILKTLRGLDQPEPQVLVSCLVVQALHEPDAMTEPAPAELAQHLATLVPYPHFDVLTRGIVRTSTTARSVQIRMGQGELQLRPDAYDPQTGTLTAQCEFVSRDGFAFETRTAIHGGEHTVLGATGGQPIFVVLRLERID